MNPSTNQWAIFDHGFEGRELHLYVEDEKLCCTGFLRVQNATIFPKNVHFFATLLEGR